MSGPGDHVREMPPATILDDATIDALLDGDAVPHGLDHQAAFAAGVRAVGDRPPPRPSPELATLLTRGAQDVAAADLQTTLIPRRAFRRSVLAKAAGLGLAAKIGFGTTAVAAGVVGAGAAGVLPGGADRVVRDAIEVVTPVEFTDRADRLDDRDGEADPVDTDGPADTGDAGVPSLPGEHGDRVSSDASGESDGEPGVDGPTVAEQAPGATNRPPEPPVPSGTAPPASDPQATHGVPGDTPGATAPGATAPGATAPSTLPPADSANSPSP
jgi:hypothetical protein